MNLQATLKGGLGGLQTLSTSTNSAGEVTTRYLTISQGAQVQFFKRYAVVKPDLILNELGIISHARISRKGKATFVSLEGAKSLLQSDKGCAFNPKGKITSAKTTIDMCGVKYNGQQCNDFIGDCLNEIHADGWEHRDLLATEDGRVLFIQIVELINTGLGNSFHDLAWWGKHPIIEDSYQNGWYTIDHDEMEDLVDQQRACGGWFTMLDEKKEEGLSQLNIKINDGEVSTDRKQYIGDTFAKLDEVINAMPTKMKIKGKGGVNGRSSKPVILVDPKFFRKFEQDLRNKYDMLDASLQYTLNGKFCETYGCDGQDFAEGVLKYNGYKVVCMDIWELMDETLGVNTFRILAVGMGNLGLAYDIPLDQKNGLAGLRITQKLEDPYDGMTYMSTRFEMGTSILNLDHVTMASRTFVPKA